MITKLLKKSFSFLVEQMAVFTNHQNEIEATKPNGIEKKIQIPAEIKVEIEGKPKMAREKLAKK
jgi:hypothetical protein